MIYINMNVLNTPKSSITKCQRSIKFSGTKIWNDIPQSTYLQKLSI